MKLVITIFAFASGALWGHYGPVHVVLPSMTYAWTDGSGNDGCGMCPWHDTPEETREHERKEREKLEDGRCGSDDSPDKKQDCPGVHG